jgi:glycosyltransferase involved in cell wall biosynthesis
MRVLVASAFEAGSQFAHAINTAKMAQGFASLGHEVFLVCRRDSGEGVSPEELAGVYGLTAPVRWMPLPQSLCAQRVNDLWGFALAALPTLAMVRPHLVFARNYVFPWVTSRLGIETCAESHAHTSNQGRPLLRLVSASKHRAFRAWVTISRRLAEHYRSLGVPAHKLMVLPDACDLRLFLRPNEVLTSLSPYSEAGPHVVYAGHLYDFKGIPTILDTAVRLPRVLFHFVGGWSEDIARQKSRAAQLGLSNVRFHGLQPQSLLPPYLWHADVLLLTHAADHPSAEWTSPLKLGEYLASGKPVIASDIPGIREWMTDKEVEFVKPGDPAVLASCIKGLLEDGTRARRLALAGLARAKSLSYERRAEALLDGVA